MGPGAPGIRKALPADRRISPAHTKYSGGMDVADGFGSVVVNIVAFAVWFDELGSNDLNPVTKLLEFAAQ